MTRLCLPLPVFSSRIKVPEKIINLFGAWILLRRGRMDIIFSNDDLRRLCSEERTATRLLGKVGARKLKSRVADLLAAANVRELVAGRPHPLKGERLGQFALDLEGGCRLVFEPADTPRPQLDDGSIDWGRVTAARVVFIGDYHE